MAVTVAAVAGEALTTATANWRQLMVPMAGTAIAAAGNLYSTPKVPPHDANDLARDHYWKCRQHPPLLLSEVTTTRATTYKTHMEVLMSFLKILPKAGKGYTSCTTGLGTTVKVARWSCLAPHRSENVEPASSTAKGLVSLVSLLPERCLFRQ